MADSYLPRLGRLTERFQFAMADNVAMQTPVEAGDVSRIRIPGAVTTASLIATVVLLALWADEVVTIATRQGELAFRIDGDRQLYANAALSWVRGDGFYLPHQLAGPYEITPGDVLYPPPMLLIFAPFAMVQSLLYYLVPLAITAGVVFWHRPRIDAWPAIAFCLWWPTTTVVIAGGNPGIWLMAFMAMATVSRAASPLIFLKPTLAPFAFFGVNRRSWWGGLAALVAVSILFLPLWPDYITATANARGGGGIFYSISQAPMLLLPLVSWARRTRRGEPSAIGTA
jgi:hypothetical protein